MSTDDDRDILDDEPPATSAQSSSPPATNGSAPPASDGAARGGASRRSFLIGAAAGAGVGVIAGAGVVGVAGGGLSVGPGGALRTGPAPRGQAGEPVAGQVISLTVNGLPHEVFVRANQTLAELLREELALTGTKIGCNRSECSACTVLLNGVPVNSCSELAIRANGATVVTIEGLEKDGKLSPVQAAFAKQMGLQCGFCTPGQILQATALLRRFPNPTDEQIMKQMSGNLCKCSAYPHILASIREAAKTARA
jgi:aerobic-type carbon monoxide dehydrogenase small subunit (CoxS/CutS family)